MTIDYKKLSRIVDGWDDIKMIEQEALEEANRILEACGLEDVPELRVIPIYDKDEDIVKVYLDCHSGEPELWPLYDESEGSLEDQALDYVRKYNLR